MAGLHDFFTYTILTKEENSIEAEAKLNAEHAVYEGHFPGNPVVPGVCQVHMIKVLLSDALGCAVDLEEARDIKFLAMIQPAQMNTLKCTISLQQLDEQHYKVTAMLSHEETNCLRLRGTYKLKETV